MCLVGWCGWFSWLVCSLIGFGLVGLVRCFGCWVGLVGWFGGAEEPRCGWLCLVGWLVRSLAGWFVG